MSHSFGAILVFDVDAKDDTNRAQTVQNVPGLVTKLTVIFINTYVFNVFLISFDYRESMSEFHYRKLVHVPMNLPENENT
jgi:hypothetical protein